MPSFIKVQSSTMLANIKRVSFPDTDSEDPFGLCSTLSHYFALGKVRKNEHKINQKEKTIFRTFFFDQEKY